MNRRTLEVKGWVNFPTHLPSSGEGGCVVKLFVPAALNLEWEQCCGATCLDILSECLIGSDQKDAASWKLPLTGPVAYKIYERCTQAVENYYFPGCNNREVEPSYEKFLSRPAYAVVVLGTTGWSPPTPDDGRTWICRFEDLTDQGKDLYTSLWRLYGIKPHILTFLDT